MSPSAELKLPGKPKDAAEPVWVKSMNWVKQQFLLPVLLLAGWLTNGCSAVGVQLLALAFHLCIVRMLSKTGKRVAPLL